MKKVLQLKRNGLNWPGADVSLEDNEADRRIKSGEAVEYSDANRKKVQTLVAGTTQGGISAEQVSMEDLAELEKKGFKLAEAGPTKVVPIEHEPKFRDVAAHVNPPVDNAGAMRPTGPRANLGQEQQEQSEAAHALDDLGLDARAMNALTAGGLKDMESVAKYGEENENFQGIEGIGAATDEQIRAALKKASRKS